MVTRIGGLSTGMDIDSLVAKLMKAERMPLEKVMAKQTKNDWKRDAYREVNRNNLAYSQKLFDNYKLEGKWKEEDGSYNVDKLVDKIKQFVSDYNEYTGSVNKKVNEQSFKDYQPLTDEQRESMSDKEIEKWEQKAQSGVLRNDNILRQGLSNLRSSIYEGTSGDFGSLTDLGITTTSNYRDGGQLTIDEKKLREKLKENPDAVVSLFTSDSGIVSKLREGISATSRAIEVKSGRDTQTEAQYTMGKESIQLKKQIDAWTKRLASKEDQYWKQFTAMEKTINTMNAQSASLFGGQAVQQGV